MTIEALRNRLLSHNFGPDTVDRFEAAIRADERDKWADPDHDTDQPKYDINVRAHPRHCGCMPGHSAVF